MILGSAKEIARDWVNEHAAGRQGFRGAFGHGSATWLADDIELAPTSDLDVVIVLDAQAVPAGKPGKIVFRDVLLDVSFLSVNELVMPEMVLSNSHLAGSFRSPSVLADPSGWLIELNRAVASDFAKRHWVIERCKHAGEKVLGNLRSLDRAQSSHDQVISWLFAAGVTTHILLTAGLLNPTVRTRYLATRQLLAVYQRLTLYEDLLALLGCARLSRIQAEAHLAALIVAFDAAKAVVKSPFPFASDISDAGRPAVIDGSKLLIECGDHREAVFWLAVTYSRCQHIFAVDAPELVGTFDSGYRSLLADLGIASPADLERRCEDVRAFLPTVWRESEAIIAANPDIED